MRYIDSPFTLHYITLHPAHGLSVIGLWLFEPSLYVPTLEFSDSPKYDPSYTALLLTMTGSENS